MRNLITEIVDSDPDLRVVDTAPDGGVALQKVRQLKPDAVLLDIEMPEMSGLETLRRLNLRSTCKVVILSSLVANEDSSKRVEALRLGAVATIGKPSGGVSFDLKQKRASEIVRTLRRALHLPDPVDPIIVPGCLDTMFRGQVPEGVDPRTLTQVEPLRRGARVSNANSSSVSRQKPQSTTT